MEKPTSPMSSDPYVVVTPTESVDEDKITTQMNFDTCSPLAIDSNSSSKIETELDIGHSTKRKANSNSTDSDEEFFEPSKVSKEMENMATTGISSILMKRGDLAMSGDIEIIFSDLQTYFSSLTRVHEELRSEISTKAIQEFNQLIVETKKREKELAISESFLDKDITLLTEKFESLTVHLKESLEYAHAIKEGRTPAFLIKDPWLTNLEILQFIETYTPNHEKHRHAVTSELQTFQKLDSMNTIAIRAILLNFFRKVYNFTSKTNTEGLQAKLLACLPSLDETNEWEKFISLNPTLSKIEKIDISKPISITYEGMNDEFTLSLKEGVLTRKIAGIFGNISTSFKSEYTVITRTGWMHCFPESELDIDGKRSMRKGKLSPGFADWDIYLPFCEAWKNEDNSFTVKEQKEGGILSLNRNINLFCAQSSQDVVEWIEVISKFSQMMVKKIGKLHSQCIPEINTSNLCSSKIESNTNNDPTVTTLPNSEDGIVSTSKIDSEVRKQNTAEGLSSLTSMKNVSAYGKPISSKKRDK
ncbi:hypothetical protein HK096_003279 [Nowakowskiella sp. JEL0078]|nr:hypothetical protein HK096_003279 [Nowakowskiella sp. JEL0078]